MTILDRPRAAFALLFAVCVGLVAFALYLQHARQLEPCPMCVLQRYVFIMIALVVLVAAIHGSRGLALKLYGGAVIALGVIGSGVAMRHLWVQRFPPPNAGCAVELEFLMESLPFTSWLPAIFRGSADCSKVDWTFIGVSIPGWALVWFVIFIVFIFLILRRTRRP
ncbi:MAG TPA: disulfide bond formation protein B [Burkholderiales bacterium]|nr:disulfide bond formation protein B [Burkholderiales bacterium]